MVFPLNFWLLFAAAMVISSIGFKNYVWFISIGYGFAIAGEGLLMMLLYGQGPPFFAGILITVLFGVILKFFTPGGYVSYTEHFGRFLVYLIFPALAIAIPKAAMAVKLLRSSLLEQAELDYTRTAYSRGNTTKDVLYKHVLQNAMIPVITFLGMTLADIFTGSIIIEQVFNIPGLGRILLTSISNRDFPVVMAIIVLLAFAVITINLLVDIVYHLIDPRIRTDK